MLITTCDVVCREASFDGEVPQVLVSEDVKSLHEFCQGENPIILPCGECKDNRPLKQNVGWNPRQVANKLVNGKAASKRLQTNKVAVAQQLDQITRNGVSSNQPYYRYGVDRLADIDSSQLDSTKWKIFREECGHQCKMGILNTVSEFRKDIECTYNHMHKGFVDFIIVPAVNQKPDELIAYEEKLIKERAKDPDADVEQSSKEKKAEELYSKYCEALLLVKVGQYPALRDMHLFDTKKYRKVLGDDYNYYTLSIALYGEGVGIGAFAYLRRIFENIVEEVHQQCVAECNERVAAQETSTETGEANEPSTSSSAFDEATYQSLHFNDKISYLEDNYSKVIIPPEIEPIRNKLYGVISKGIHKSSEEDCLEMYPYVKYTIEIFLDDKIQKLERQKKLKDAITKIQNK